MALDIDAILSAMVQCAPEVSDLHFAIGQPPLVESQGKLIPAVRDPGKSLLTADATREIADALIRGKDALRAVLEEKGDCDCSYTLPDGRRFRANIFSVQHNLCIVLRALPSSIPTLDHLKFPNVLRQIPRLNNGMVLVTGSTGTGKSTTMAALIDAINATRPVHILTLEDPVEFRHHHKLGCVNQREKGVDFESFADALRAGLRQAPKVILVGEMRDRETMEIALKAAETGHLVLSTLHTIDAGQTIHRIVGMFHQDEESLLRSRLAAVLRFVVAQRLVPKVGGGRVAALEIMGSNLRTREVIEKGETEHKTFQRVIADSRPFEWQTFDQHICELYAQGVISEESAHSYSTDRAVMRGAIDRLQVARGEDTSELGPLEMERHAAAQPR
jgi:twitching motility protein PilT